MSSNTNTMLCYPSPRTVFLIVAVCCVMESILCGIILRYVAYTEIDWRAYMQEVEGWWVHGEYDYRLLRGDTGPLVYPAGFLYLFAVLRSWTDDGQNIWKAQILFANAYVLQQGMVVWMFVQIWSMMLKRRLVGLSKLSSSETITINNANETSINLVETVKKSSYSWGIAIALLCLSKRLHSIFILRLFNDGMAMLIFYGSVLLFMKNRWNWGCLIFSFAVSIKMNILLFAPGLLLLLLQSQKSVRGTFVCLAICATSQILIGLPFLCTFPISYLKKAFELDRVFIYRWTVNWKVSTYLMF
jgi:alpha-1,3-mannosyltransferase